MNNIAIIAVAYNRIYSLTRLIKSLENAWYGSKHPTLIISIDKSDTDIIEKYADGYVWPHGNKIVKKHKNNLGLCNHMLSLGQWFDQFDTLVILEDDIVVSPAFYNYVCQASEKYYYNHNIAGLSLYSYSTNYITGTPFSPVINEYDGYFMNCAMSWGEVWMKNQWNEFYKWYLSHKEFNDELNLPESLYRWEKSWLKYHTKYCIEKNMYFLYPYTALTTNFGDPGTHNKNFHYTTFQLILQQGIKKYNFPENETDAVCYDGFFENKRLYDVLGYSESECCIDLYGSKRNRSKFKYWLTTEIANLPIIKSFGISLKPLEQNVISNIEGTGIYLYYTEYKQIKSTPNGNVLLYRYNIGDIDSFIRMFGFKNLIKQLILKICSKLCIMVLFVKYL